MRKKRAATRRRTPDPKFNDVLVSEFVNNIMKSGKKHTARNILYDAFGNLRTASGPAALLLRAARSTSELGVRLTWVTHGSEH